jgi:hypothetical protein
VLASAIIGLAVILVLVIVVAVYFLWERPRVEDIADDELAAEIALAELPAVLRHDSRLQSAI